MSAVVPNAPGNRRRSVPLTPTLSPLGRGRALLADVLASLLGGGSSRPLLPPREKVPEGRMRRRAATSVIALSLFLALPSAAAGPPPDYRVAFWYRRADPLSSMRHQVYDVRRGEYPATAADWLRTMRTTRPDYEAYIRDFYLDPTSGESARKQLATMILREYRDRGGPSSGYGLRDEQGIYGTGGLPALIPMPRLGLPTAPAFRSDASAYSRGYGFLNSPGANRPPSYALPPTTTSPFPYPYTRPHP